MGIRSTVETASSGNQPNTVGLFHPFLDRQGKPVEACFEHNSLEFGGIKVSVVDFLPNS